MSAISSEIIKGGALLEDTRRFLERWDLAQDPSENLRRFSCTDLLGKTEARRRDVLNRLKERFVTPGADIIRALKRLIDDPLAFRIACYYETARSDPLFAAFAEEALFPWARDGRREVDVRAVLEWVRSNPQVPVWSEYTTLRVCRGLLSALRDFGILEGPARGRRKRIVHVHPGMRGFAYVALRERHRLGSDRALLASTAWHWYLLDSEAVRRLFLEADRAGILRFYEAGSIVRIDWFVRDLEEVAHVDAA